MPVTVIYAWMPCTLVLDPLGGSGTKYAVCEERQRRWVGVEIGDIEPIRARLGGSVKRHHNSDYVEPCRKSLVA